MLQHLSPATSLSHQNQWSCISFNSSIWTITTFSHSEHFHPKTCWRTHRKKPWSGNSLPVQQNVSTSITKIVITLSTLSKACFSMRVNRELEISFSSEKSDIYKQKTLSKSQTITSITTALVTTSPFMALRVWSNLAPMHSCFTLNFKTMEKWNYVLNT